MKKNRCIIERENKKLRTNFIKCAQYKKLYYLNINIRKICGEIMFLNRKTI